MLVYSSMSLVTHSSSDYTALYGFLGDGTTTGEAVEGGVIPVGAECVDGEHVVSCSRLLLEGGAELTDGNQWRYADNVDGLPVFASLTSRSTMGSATAVPSSCSSVLGSLYACFMRLT